MKKTVLATLAVCAFLALSAAAVLFFTPLSDGFIATEDVATAAVEPVEKIYARAQPVAPDSNFSGPYGPLSSGRSGLDSSGFMLLSFSLDQPTWLTTEDSMLAVLEREGLLPLPGAISGSIQLDDPWGNYAYAIYTALGIEIGEESPWHGWHYAALPAGWTTKQRTSDRSRDESTDFYNEHGYKVFSLITSKNPEDLRASFHLEPRYEVVQQVITSEGVVNSFVFSDPTNPESVESRHIILDRMLGVEIFATKWVSVPVEVSSWSSLFAEEDDPPRFVARDSTEGTPINQSRRQATDWLDQSFGSQFDDINRRASWGVNHDTALILSPFEYIKGGIMSHAFDLASELDKSGGDGKDFLLQLLDIFTDD
ncbi:hypothetical protein FWH13_02780 [Candidatus Saccharibacteria bacterium]|nr:hypothetical protein [Candidatus Saccharibacteria bacterium]